MARLRFGAFEVDERAGILTEDGAVVHLQPKPFELLLKMIERPGEIVTREALEAHLWPDVHVTEDSLTQAIARLRRAVGSDILQTVPRRGYRFAAEIERLESAPPAPAPAVAARSLHGREGAIAEAVERVRSGRIAWIAGASGMGCSALARAVAERLSLPAIEVSPTRARGLLSSVADALGVVLGDPSEQVLALSVALSERCPLLLLADDIHLDPAAPGILERWQRVGDLAIVAASHARGAFPAILVDGLALADAIALLRDRGAAIDPEDPAVGRLIEALDGNPLALTLAADRLRWMRAGELCARIAGAERFALLGGGDAEPSLLRALEASLLALTADVPGARESLYRLSALDVALPVALAESVLGDLPRPIDLLQRLTDAGWIRVRHEGDDSDVSLPANQRACLSALGAERDGISVAEGVRRAVAWCEARALAAVTASDRASVRWLVRHADLLFAAAHAVPPDHSPDVLVRAALVAGDHRGIEVPEAERLIRAALAHPGLRESERAGLVLRLGQALVVRSRAGAISELRRAVELAESHGAALRSWVRAELSLAMAHDPDEALAQAELAVQHARESGDSEHAIHARYARAVARWRSNRPDVNEVAALLAEAEARQSSTVASLTELYANILQNQGYLDEAESAQRSLGALSASHRPTRSYNLANLLAGRGALSEAEECYHEAIAGSRALGRRRLELAATLALARTEVAAGRLERADHRLSEMLAEGGFDTLSSVGRADFSFVRGLLALRQGQPSLARQRIERAIQERLDATLYAFAAIFCAKADVLDEAERWYGQAADLPPLHDTPPALALALANILWARSARDPSRIAERDTQIALLDRSPGPRLAPLSQQLVEMSWLRPEQAPAQARSALGRQSELDP